MTGTEENWKLGTQVLENALNLGWTVCVARFW